jgi:hypothetical protein
MYLPNHSDSLSGKPFFELLIARIFFCPYVPLWQKAVDIFGGESLSFFLFFFVEHIRNPPPWKNPFAFGFSNEFFRKMPAAAVLLLATKNYVGGFCRHVAKLHFAVSLISEQ